MYSRDGSSCVLCVYSPLFTEWFPQSTSCLNILIPPRRPWFVVAITAARNRLIARPSASARLFCFSKIPNAAPPSVTRASPDRLALHGYGPRKHIMHKYLNICVCVCARIVITATGLGRWLLWSRKTFGYDDPSEEEEEEQQQQT